MNYKMANNPYSLEKITEIEYLSKISAIPKIPKSVLTDIIEQVKTNLKKDFLTVYETDIIISVLNDEYPEQISEQAYFTFDKNKEKNIKIINVIKQKITIV